VTPKPATAKRGPTRFSPVQTATGVLRLRKAQTRRAEYWPQSAGRPPFRAQCPRKLRRRICREALRPHLGRDDEACERGRDEQRIGAGRTVRSAPADARTVPLWSNATARIQPSWPASVRTHRYEAASQSRMLWSQPADASNDPLGLKATVTTVSVWPAIWTLTIPVVLATLTASATTDCAASVR